MNNSVKINRNPLYKSREFLNNEVQLDHNISAKGVRFEGKEEWDNVFLTGATGFIGAFLLIELIKKTKAQIYCLVRDANNEDGKKRIINNLKKYELWEEQYTKRIKAIRGDLNASNLGVSQSEYLKLTKEIDVIFHFGASINWTAPYNKEATINIKGLQEIARLATTYKLKTINYSSSMGAFASLKYPIKEPIEEDEIIEKGESLYGGYCQTKWVCEKIINEGRRRGIPINIFRLGDVKGHSRTGISDLNNFGNLFLSVCINRGVAPDIDYTVNYLPIDYLVEGIIAIAKKLDGRSKNFQFNNSQITKWRNVIDEMNNYGFRVDVIPLKEWLLIFKNSDKSELERKIKPVFRKLRIDVETKDKTPFDLIMHLYARKHSTTNTRHYLGKTKIACAKLIDDGVLKKYFAYFQRKGLISGNG